MSTESLPQPTLTYTHVPQVAHLVRAGVTTKAMPTTRRAPEWVRS
jgi:hypothetical protein